MITFFKANCIAIYLLAIAALFMELPWGSGPFFQRVAVAFVAIHIIEAVVAFKHVKAYKGPLLNSVVLTLLYGLLHWLPIAKASKSGETSMV